MVEISESKNRVMVICAHPDDLDFGCSGTMTLWAGEGKEIIYVLCTSGDKGTDDPGITPENLMEMRENEQRCSAANVGAKDLVFLRLRDGEVENNHHLRRELVRLIRKYRPHIVLTHDPANRLFENQYICHSDHRAVGEAVFDAIYPAAGNRNYFPELLLEGYEPHKVSEIYFFGTHKPDVWVDISPVMQEKTAALLCHKSQLRSDESFVSWIRERFSELGKPKGMKYAEVFRRLRLGP